MKETENVPNRKPTTGPLTAHAQTEAKRERVLKAAVDWVYDQSCANALAELEEAVTDLIGAQL